MLVHTLDPEPAEPARRPAGDEQVGVDPDAFASAAVAVPHTGGTA